MTEAAGTDGRTRPGYEIVGADGLTPRQRLERLGYEIDETGSTVEHGHDGASNRAEFEANLDLWSYFDRPATLLLELRCHSSRELVATVHQHPDGSLWYRWGVGSTKTGWTRFARQTPITDWLTPQGSVPLRCREHGWLHVDGAWLEGQARSTRRKADSPCGDTPE